MDPAMINTAVSQGSMRSAAMPPARSIVLAVANMLTVRYQDGWINALSGERCLNYSSVLITARANCQELYTRASLASISLW